jgi:hypothetical protein
LPVWWLERFLPELFRHSSGCIANLGQGMWS